MRIFAALALCSAALLWAGDFWQSKPPADWTADEIELILKDSPWAQSASVEYTGERGKPLGAPGSGPVGVGFPGGVGVPGGRLPDGGWGGGPMRSPNNALNPDVTIRWRSARPIRLALERTGDDTVSAEAVDRFYVVEVSMLPAGMAHEADEPERLRQVSRLLLKDGAPIQARLIEVRPQPGAPGLLLFFPREAAISLEDKTVEFELTAEDYEIRRKFKLKDMEFEGRLEL